MSRIVFVEGLDDIFYQEQVAQGFAAAAIKPWQRELAKGHYFVSFVEGIAVYSKVLEDDDGDFRFTMSYSAACDYGEMGDVHISTVFQTLSPQQFEAFKKKGWPAREDAVRETLKSN